MLNIAIRRRFRVCVKRRTDIQLVDLSFLNSALIQDPFFYYLTSGRTENWSAEDWPTGNQYMRSQLWYDDWYLKTLSLYLACTDNFNQYNSWTSEVQHESLKVGLYFQLANKTRSELVSWVKPRTSCKDSCSDTTWLPGLTACACLADMVTGSGTESFRPVRRSLICHCTPSSTRFLMLPQRKQVSTLDLAHKTVQLRLLDLKLLKVDDWRRAFPLLDQTRVPHARRKLQGMQEHQSKESKGECSSRKLKPVTTTGRTTLQRKHKRPRNSHCAEFSGERSAGY